MDQDRHKWKEINIVICCKTKLHLTRGQIAEVSMSVENGRNYSWERVRYLTRTLADHSMRRKKYAFQPGDIACCHGSIERAFVHHLRDLEIALEPWEGEKPFKQPLRFCVVNKRFEGDYYEVFLMTTFGQARTFDGLGPIAQNYGIPVGGTNWFENIDPIQTYPPTFGWDRTSFIFAIPVLVRDVIPAALRWTVRLLPGELKRLRNISDHKMENTYRIHRIVRASLKHRLYKSGLSSSVDDEQDDFMPTDEEEVVIETEQEYPPLPTPVSKHTLTTRRPPIRHDLSWLLSYASNRIYNYSTYLDHRGIHRKGPIQLQLGSVPGDSPKQRCCPSLPKPYYSPYLRVNIRAISRILR